MEPFSIPDFLISNRIKTALKNNSSSIEVIVAYYSPEEISSTIPFFKRWFTDITRLTNEKNKELYYHASKYATDKGFFPPRPPLKLVD